LHELAVMNDFSRETGRLGSDCANASPTGTSSVTGSPLIAGAQEAYRPKAVN